MNTNNTHNGKHTKYRLICCTWILTVLRDSLSNLPSSAIGGPAAGVVMSPLDVQGMVESKERERTALSAGDRGEALK